MKRVLAILLWAAFCAFSVRVVDAQGLVDLPHGQNLRDRPEQRTDITLIIGSDGHFVLNAAPVDDDQIDAKLGAIFSMLTSDKILYVRVAAHLDYARVLNVNAMAAKSGVCVAALIGDQEPGTASRVIGDVSQSDRLVRRAIDVQLPLPNAPASVPIAENTRIVLEVLPGPTYRINAATVLPANLSTRLSEIFNPRPVKVLFIKGDPVATIQDVFHAMDIARGSGVIVIRQAPSDLVVPDRLPAIDLSMKVTPVSDIPVPGAAGSTGRCRGEDGQAMRVVPGSGGQAGTVYFQFQVETPVQAIAGNPTPQYPDADQ